MVTVILRLVKSMWNGRMLQYFYVRNYAKDVTKGVATAALNAKLLVSECSFSFDHDQGVQHILQASYLAHDRILNLVLSFCSSQSFNKVSGVFR